MVRSGVTREAVIPPGVDAVRVREEAQEHPTDAAPGSAEVRPAPAVEPSRQVPAPPPPGTSATEPAPTRGRPKRSRLDGLRHLVGVQPDATVAEVAGLTAEAVRQYRVKHGIPSAKAAPPSSESATPTTVREARRLAKEQEQRVSLREWKALQASTAPEERSAPATTAAPQVSSSLERHRDLVGSMSDRDVAARLSVTVDAVAAFRRKHGIPLFGSTAPSSVAPTSSARAPATPEHVESSTAGPTPTHTADMYPPPESAPPVAVEPSATPGEGVRSRRKSPIDAHAHLLGKMSDADVAQVAGVTASGVFQYRKSRGIPGYQRRSGAARDAESAASPLLDHHGVDPGRDQAPAQSARSEAPDPDPLVVSDEVRAAPFQRSPTARTVAYSYIVTVLQGEVEELFGVIGADIADASARAVRAVVDGEVISLVRHLEALV